MPLAVFRCRSAFSSCILLILPIGSACAQPRLFCQSKTDEVTYAGYKDGAVLNNSSNCLLLEFDRPGDRLGQVQKEPDPNTGLRFTKADESTDFDLVSAINGPASKIIYSGTVVSVPLTDDPVKNCQLHDFRVLVLSAESSNVLQYGPADIAEFCTHPNMANNRLMLILPVSVVWVEIFEYPSNNDPLHKGPGPIPGMTVYCNHPIPNQMPVPPEFDVPGGIQPCDLYGRLKGAYGMGGIYNRVTQPGTSQGTLTFVPAIGKVPASQGAPAGEKPPAETLNFDVQVYPSGVWGPGWLGAPIVFEKANAATANLDSLSVALSYDIPFSQWSKFPSPNGSGASASAHVSMRLPDFRIQYGPEIATASPHDINAVAAASLRVPVLLDLGYQPSTISILPVVGLEGGNHVHTSLPGETDSIFRKVVGFDASVRAPFIITHSFLGDKPLTVDFSWRTRYLSYPEPFTDYVSGVAEVLTKQQRTYWRGDFIVPVATLVQFKVTVQHGGLPPDFAYLGYSLNLGLTFANPGYSEH